MTTTTPARGVTFRVDDVAPAAKRLPTASTRMVLQRLLEGEFEACSDPEGRLVSGLSYQPLLAAVYTAFSEHRPLVLSPDAVWVTLAQGVAHHMTIHAERLRSRFVNHPGRLTLGVRFDDFVKGSPRNAWDRAFAAWSGQIREHVGAELHDQMVCSFSTTGPVERAASEVVLMDIFERYFHYEMLCVCGIPEITLTGRPEDWEQLQAKIEGLAPFDMDWWLEHLRPIAAQFVRASRGDVDLSHWQAICKLRDEYGGAIINGWVAKLFPYLREFPDGPARRRNWIFETGEGFSTRAAPSGLSKVPFTWRIEPPGMSEQKFSMEAVGGLFGIEQDAATGALSAKVGWAVRERHGPDALFDRLIREHATKPGNRAAMWQQEEVDAVKPLSVMKPNSPKRWMPEEMGQFYYRTDGADLFGEGNAAKFRFVPFDEIDCIFNPSVGAEKEGVSSIRVVGGGWFRFCDLPGQGCIAIDGERKRVDSPEGIRAYKELKASVRPLLETAERQIEQELAEWEAHERKGGTFSNDSHRRKRSELQAGHAELQAIERELSDARVNQMRWINLIIWCPPGKAGLKGECPVIAESFQEFLERALESEGKYWWLEPGWVGYGDGVTRGRER